MGGIENASGGGGEASAAIRGLSSGGCVLMRLWCCRTGFQKCIHPRCTIHATLNCVDGDCDSLLGGLFKTAHQPTTSRQQPVPVVSRSSRGRVRELWSSGVVTGFQFTLRVPPNPPPHKPFFAAFFCSKRSNGGAGGFGRCRRLLLLLLLLRLLLRPSSFSSFSFSSSSCRRLPPPRSHNQKYNLPPFASSK
jgi:hypothetical protein